MMKRLISGSFAVLVAALVLTGAGHRRIVHADQGCGPTTIASTYGFAVSGLGSASFNGVPQRMGKFDPVAAAGTFIFDGRSTVTRSFTLSFGGAIIPVSDSGTYTLASDCTGSAIFPDAGETWNLVAVGGGNEIDTMIATAGRALAGTLTRQ